MSHRRYNCLLDEWVLVAANRVNRPWQGAKETVATHGLSTKTSEQINALAPGGSRPNGNVTADYTETFVFQNDFPSLTDDGEPIQQFEDSDSSDFFQTQKARGTCRVICYHPDSRLTMALMTTEQIENVIDTWVYQLNDLKETYEWIQVFENKGEIMGCSNPHPHGQLWATAYLPNFPKKKFETQKSYTERTGKVMLVEYLKQELERKERIVAENESWVVLVPFWGFWPFETMVLPRRHIISLYEITEEEKRQLASILKILIIKYDNLFKCSFPYSMGWFGAPTGSFLKENCNFWTLHAVFYPPLLRSSSVKKFVASYELLCEPQRDMTPEKAAEILRDQEDVHYSLSSSSSIPMSS